MNNGEEARKGGGEKNSDGDRRRRRRDWGSDVHLTGGGVPPLDLSCFAALTAVALTPPPPCLSLSLCFSLFRSLPPLFCLFFPCCSLPPPATHSIQNTWFDRKWEEGGALITAWYWCRYEFLKVCLSDWHNVQTLIQAVNFSSSLFFFSSCVTTADNSHSLLFTVPVIPS